MEKNRKRVYLDNAATTPVDREVLEAMLPYLEDFYGNPSSIHSHGREVRTGIEKARKTVADLLQCTPSEIFFTSGGTEADNTALRCSVDTLGIKHIITSPIEHHAVLHTSESLAKSGKVKLSLVDIDSKGAIDHDHLESLLKSSDKAIMSFMHANNEIGNLNDLHALGGLAHQYGALFHSDTVQTMGHYVHDLRTLPVSFLVGAAHKFNGPKGIGFLYVNRKNKIHPFIYGGAQERNMRGGTENVYGIIGIAKALEIAYRDMDHHQKQITGLKAYMIEKLKANIPGITFNGYSENLEKSLYTVLSASFPPSDDNDMLLFHLDLEGISASGGSACSSGSNKGSHVLTALKANPGRASIRFSFSKYNTTQDVDYVIEKLRELVPVNA
jgi:cysteine desulfurase